VNCAIKINTLEIVFANFVEVDYVMDAVSLRVAQKERYIYNYYNFILH